MSVDHFSTQNPNTAWKYRRYQLVVDLVTIPECLVRVLTLGFVNPQWGWKTTKWALTRIRDTRRKIKSSS